MNEKTLEMIYKLKTIGFIVNVGDNGQSFSIYREGDNPNKIYAIWTHKNLRLMPRFYDKLNTKGQDTTIKVITRWQQAENLKAAGRRKLT